MWWPAVLLLLIGIVFVPVELSDTTNCPIKCTCQSIAKPGHGLKLKCGGTAINKITTIKEIDFGDYRNDVLQL